MRMCFFFVLCFIMTMIQWINIIKYIIITFSVVRKKQFWPAFCSPFVWQKINVRNFHYGKLEMISYERSELPAKFEEAFRGGLAPKSSKRYQCRSCSISCFYLETSLFSEYLIQWFPYSVNFSIGKFPFQRIFFIQWISFPANFLLSKFVTKRFFNRANFLLSEFLY